jgi:hypothetical protein
MARLSLVLRADLVMIVQHRCLRATEITSSRFPQVNLFTAQQKTCEIATVSRFTNISC